MQLKIKNVLIPQNNSIFLKGHICIDQGKIKNICYAEKMPESEDAEVIDAEGLIISSGFIDTHNHGGNGYGYNCRKNELEKVENRLSSVGVTSVLATWESSTIDDTLIFIEKMRDMKDKNYLKNIELLGIHLEGPYFNKARKGMHQERFIRLASKKEVNLILEAACGLVKVWSLAPEFQENMNVIEMMVNNGISVALAHTEADYDTAMEAFSRGANRVTHAFNAMPALNQRYNGIITAAWQHGAFMELIADNHHVSPTVMKMFVSASDPDKIVLVSDNNECSGLEDGSYNVHNRKLVVTSGRLELESGILAGGIIGLNQSARNVMNCGFSAWTALKMASANPARAIGVFDRKGSIATGKDADLVILDGQLNVIMTIKAGRVVYRSKSRSLEIK